VGLFFAIGLLLLGREQNNSILQTAFIELGGQVAHGEGWYQQRRLAQIIFVLVLGAALAGICSSGLSNSGAFFKNHVFTLFG